MGEVAGHLHPAARVMGSGRSVRRRCFAGDGYRLVLPAFGAYAGGLNVLDSAFAGLFAAADLPRLHARRRPRLPRGKTRAPSGLASATTRTIVGWAKARSAVPTRAVRRGHAWARFALPTLRSPTPTKVIPTPKTALTLTPVPAR